MHLFSTYDMGVIVYSKVPNTIGALIKLEVGLQEGYPLCCVQEFAIDTLEGRHPAVRRGTVTLGDKTWVPCASCLEFWSQVGAPFYKPY